MKLPISDTSKRLGMIGFSGLLIALALNFFLIPGNIFGAGTNGIAQLISAIFNDLFHIKIGTGYLIMLINIPIGILGWYKIGRTFTYYSILTVAVTTIFTIILPVHQLSTNPLMAALFGGVITGAGVGFALKYGFSTGGMDIIALVLTKTTGRTVGSLMLLTNMIIILTAGFYFSWESALYTIISNYAMSRVVDSIHTSHEKLTAFVVTKKADVIISTLQKSLIRGITVIDSKGAFSNENSKVLMLVITRYELYNLKMRIREVDPNAFINLVNTADIEGNFLNSDQQELLRREQLTK
ncbi:YitT family protein [Dellaglioa carnosa]|uniref:YitT family protein n=1 Tax=Dellaglioa carnosa TaxID=2995136 RepID=UPI0022A8A1EF|nr:YitT family protein [Dellaglioa carnosa]MCZ2492643.1 YitT family protein [Dellaglioa carnosa]